MTLDTQHDIRRLFIAWRHPETRQYVPVARVDREPRADGALQYSFEYLKGAATEPEFEPLDSFPDLHQRYESDELFAFLENRVMPRDRSDWPEFARTIDVPEDAEPFFVLARTGGRRVTDTFEVFAPPVRDAVTGRCHMWFLVRGIRHLEGATERVARLRVGDELRIVPDRDNEISARAMLLEHGRDEPVGWIPHLLLDTVEAIRVACGADMRVVVVQVNAPDVPARARLLCELQSCWPDAVELPSGPEFQPLV